MKGRIQLRRFCPRSVTVVKIPPSLSFLHKDAHHVNGPTEKCSSLRPTRYGETTTDVEARRKKVENWPLRLRLREGAVIQESGRLPGAVHKKFS